jgi:predicted transcriptional regulator
MYKVFQLIYLSKDIRDRIQKGLDDADAGRVTPLEKVKEELAKKIKDHREK